MTRPGSGLGIGMPLRYFGSSMVVEMRVPCVHAGRADRPDLFLRQLGGGEAAAAFPEALELLIFVRADEVAGDLAVARHGDGLALGAHPVAAEIAGKLGSRDSFGRIHGSLSFTPNIRNSRELCKSRKLRNLAAPSDFSAAQLWNLL